MPLLILAGGFGTRLRSAVSDVPKPLAPVGNNPFLRYLIDQWIAQGVRNMIFLLHHQAALIENYLAAEKAGGLLNGCEIRTVIEEQPLGTGGSVAYAAGRCELKSSFLVVNADTWLGSGIHRMCDASSPSLAVVHVDNSERYGSVQVDKNMVLSFREKQQTAGAGWINAGLYHLHAELFRSWDGKPFSLERELFTNLAAESRLHAVSLETQFIDIGIPEDYYRFRRWIESGKEGVL